MKVISSAVVNGIIGKKYGKYGTEFYKGMPSYSIPFEILDAPENTKTFALVLEDKDAIPVCGFSWIHWSVANLKKTKIEENESKTAIDFIQGANSWSSGLLSEPLSIEESSKYGGMAPPNAPHEYEIHIFALNKELDLQNGFYVNELYKAMEGAILEQVTYKAVYMN